MTAPEIRSIDDLFLYNPALKTVPLAIVALGANLPGAFGGPADMLRAAVPALQVLSESPVLVSEIIETEPEHCPPDSPRFANAVAVLQPRADLSAVSLLVELQKLEVGFGRQRKNVRNEARVLDLDLISFGEQCMNTEFLTLPHPRARQRLFVMQPLASIWPSFCFPGEDTTAAEHLLALKAAV